MDKKKLNLMPFIGSILLILLYTVSLRYRGFLNMQEYTAAFDLKQIFPGMSGSFLPKLPAAAATLLTGLIIWITANRMKLLHAGTAPLIYLCFPPVWWFGTSVNTVPVLTMFITLAVAGIFISMRTRSGFQKILSGITGIAGTVCAAVFSQSIFFSWMGVVMAVLPPLAIVLAIRIEKLDDRELAAGKMNRLAAAFATMLILAVFIIILPSVCRFLKVDYPEYLSLFRPGEYVFRTALALLSPLLWLYLVKETKNSVNKFYLICLAAGFVMLTLPPTLPWQRLTGTVQPRNIIAAGEEFMKSAPVIYADKNCAAAIKYTLDCPVNTVRWSSDLPPGELAKHAAETLKENDVVIVTENNILEQFLPQRGHVLYTLSSDCKLFFFIGEKK